MDNSFKKSNFSLWVKIAVYASNNKNIHSIPKNKNWEGKNIRKFNDMRSEGYLTMKKSYWNEDSRFFTPTEKFRNEFKEKYCKISKKIRPDFTDELIHRMFKSFNI